MSDCYMYSNNACTEDSVNKSMQDMVSFTGRSVMCNEPHVA